MEALDWFVALQEQQRWPKLLKSPSYQLEEEDDRTMHMTWLNVADNYFVYARYI